MKGIVLTAAGDAENLHYEELEKPQAKSDEVLIKIHAISINPVDIKTRKGGAIYTAIKEYPPVILGWDVSGVIEERGENVTGFEVGDEVFGMINFPGHGKAYAAYATAPATHLARKPSGISHEEAAATTLAALTAWQVLTQQANLQAGQHVLVHAAAGGVGHFAVQMAKNLGATVTGTASAVNHAFLRGLGIDHVIDYTNDDFSTLLSDVDVVLDPIGGDTTLKSLSVMKNGGILVSIVGGAKENVVQLAAEKGLTAKNYLVSSNGADMEQLAAMLSEKKLTAHIAQVFSFDDIVNAHRQMETGKTRGKLVVRVV